MTTDAHQAGAERPVRDAIERARLARPDGAGNPSPSPGVTLAYVDARVAIADKPAGLLVHRTREARERDALVQRVRDALGGWVYPVHRIDRPCSGAVVLARDPDAARALQVALRATGALKAYLALVRGVPPESGVLDRPLTDRATGHRRPARTRFVRLARIPSIGATLLAVRIDTGRRHQIRRHLAHAGHQLLGDTEHGKGWLNRRLRAEHGLPRLGLHAWRLDVAHPDGGRLRCVVPLAADLAEFLARVPGGTEAAATADGDAAVRWPDVVDGEDA